MFDIAESWDPPEMADMCEWPETADMCDAAEHPEACEAAEPPEAAEPIEESLLVLPLMYNSPPSLHAESFLSLHSFSL